MPILVDRASDMHFSSARKNASSLQLKLKTQVTQQEWTENYCPILPGLPDDIAKYCLALVPRTYFPVMGIVSKQWRSFIQNKEFISVRKEAGMLEDSIYFLMADEKGRGSHWVGFSHAGCKQQLPPMPGPVKAGFGVVVFYGKLFVMAGYLADSGINHVSKDVYQYDSRLNRWSVLAEMNVARRDFACAEVNGLVYAVGGYGSHGESLSSAEVYYPENNKWSLIKSLRRPRWGCFACGMEGRLYVMGGRSSFTIGNSKSVDIYNPERNTWHENKNGCVMVTAHAVIGRRLFCMEWKDQRKLAIFNSADNSWKMVPVPVTGSRNVGFFFGTLDGKLLLFSPNSVPGYQTLIYDPDAPAGSEWETSSFQPPGTCLFCVTIKT